MSKKRIIKYTGLAIISFYLLLSGYVVIDGLNRKVDNKPISQPLVFTEDPKFIDLINQYRTDNSTGPLTEDPSLENIAKIKCLDMVQRDYFSHEDPDGQQIFPTLLSNNIIFRVAGENLAEGFYNSRDTANAWFNSPTHRKNVLNMNFNKVGHYTCQNSTKFYTVQIFTN